MGIAWLLDQAVMLAMYRHPLLCDHARGQPQPETHGMARPGREIQRTMCLMTMQIDRDRYDGQVCDDESEDDFEHVTTSVS